MVEFFFQALVEMFTPAHLFFLSLGTLLGLLVGILPGLGGIAGLSIVLPFVFGMDESHALSMMIGLLAPTVTSDTFPSVLMGIPGTAGSQATVVDGFPLAKRGEGARALGAAFSASLFGGIFGAIILTGAVFAARPIILAMGFGEQLLLIILALSMIGMLTGTSALKGLTTCAIGLLIGSIGAAPATGEFRMTFGSSYLSDGIPIVIVGLGMFALPEIVDLLRRNTSISETGTLGHGWLQGLKDAIRHKWIVIRCSAIGCIVGALPGLGGSVVDWIAYGHVIQTTKDRAKFGSGDIRGVLAPESANNAKEGGALIPTLLFGIPGSGSMAILLGGFVLVGVEPGLTMMTEHLNLTFVMIWSLALANVLGALVCLGIANHVAKLTTIRYSLLAPFMIMLIFFAAFQATRDWQDLIALLAMGTLGIFMKRFGWSRPALLIGYFLAPRLEPKIYQASQVYGLSFFERPIVIILLLLTIASIYMAWRFSPNTGKIYEEGGPNGISQKRPQLIFAFAMTGFAVFALASSLQYHIMGKIFPMAVSIVALALAIPLLASMMRVKVPSAILHDLELGDKSERSGYYYLGWTIGMLGLVALIGFPFGCALFIYAFVRWHTNVSDLKALALGISGVAFLGLMSHFLTLRYPPGILQALVEMPWWLGG
ncbi:MAG: tripartite tricarboxylate transporter permease [Pseudomonadota bacterium]|nr:tripartite tricarboxylate transporter permease [Pseudomonadota bacterium]